MHDRLLDLVDQVDAAVAATRGVLPDDLVEACSRVARDVRMRLAYPESLLVVALAGGSGSGKSSLLNAIAGEEMALTGGIRPTTAVPGALAPRGMSERVARYLDALEVVDRGEHDGPEWLVLLDLPDTDSLEEGHRLQVDRLLPRVDVMVFVVDPEKYRDAALHEGYIARLARRQEQLVFVLNQVDRLRPDQVESVRRDLEAALVEDGLDRPRVVCTAAAPRSGPPKGVEDLVETLGTMRQDRRMVEERLLADLGDAAELLVGAGLGSGGLDFARRWEETRAEASRLAFAGDTAGAARLLRRLLAELAEEAGTVLGPELLGVGDETTAILLEAFDEVVAAVAPSEPRGLLDRLIGRRPLPRPDPASELAARLESRIGPRVRGILRRRAAAAAALADLALALRRVRAGDGGG